ncbi:peptidase S10 serine carboxypeptidase [Pisolithus thermaeus]|nr:peptidase S10 serine carboxypeptidase [Pisolithus thermaeus]
MLRLIHLVYLLAAFVSASLEGQAVLNELANSVIDHATSGGINGKQFVQEEGLLYELVRHPHFSQHQLRVMEPSLCDPSVKQYSGYLDVTNDKHLFFWFFESRNTPESAPLLLWLNGGPGCSSSTGLFFGLGPCSVSDRGFSTTYNPYSWNTHANIIFLDQPVSVGFSYAEDSTVVDSSELAAKDVYAFLELFLTRFPEYSKQPFHLAAESYGGIYLPNIASLIHKENKKIALVPNELLRINLESVIIGNGLTDGYIQYASIPDYLCEGPYPIFDDPNGQECSSLRSRVRTCQRLIRACRLSQLRFVCSSAEFVCNLQFYTPIELSGQNPYDARRVCYPEEDDHFCYEQMFWVERYMNIPEVKAAIGVAPQRLFKACNMRVNGAFMWQGDSVRDTPALLPELINSGIRLLVYAGVADPFEHCVFQGEERWLEVLHTDFLDEFLDAPTEVWITSTSKKLAGTVRSAGGNGSQAGNITFVTVLEAGHMVPYDQPEAALDLITKWIFDLSLTTEPSFL